MSSGFGGKKRSWRYLPPSRTAAAKKGTARLLSGGDVPAPRKEGVGMDILSYQKKRRTLDREKGKLSVFPNLKKANGGGCACEKLAKRE